MNCLTRLGYPYSFHVTPLHYLGQIGRDQELLCKVCLRERGYPEYHLRSSSSRTDANRGFANVVHTSLCHEPPILKSKLALGLAHVVLSIPLQEVDDEDFFLCRYNIAKNRGLWRESETDGRLLSPFTIPVAHRTQDKVNMLRAHPRSCLEVLFKCRIRLPPGTHVTAFSAADALVVQETLRRLGLDWIVAESIPPVEYPSNKVFRRNSLEYLRRSLDDPRWRGSRLEFDR